MYSAPGQINREEYLLGKAIDKAVDPLAQDVQLVCINLSEENVLYMCFTELQSGTDPDRGECGLSHGQIFLTFHPQNAGNGVSRNWFSNIFHRGISLDHPRFWL